MKLWLALHRVRDALILCEESVFGQYGITPEQFAVVASVKGSGGPLRPTDLALMLERSPNSVSMLVDRMVKAGLVKRTRDRKDRRVVRVSLTGKAEKAVGPATVAGWEFIEKVLSVLSDKDKEALDRLLETVKRELSKYLNPEEDMAEIEKGSFTSRPDLYKRMVKNVLPSRSSARRQLGKSGKARRRAR